MKQKEGRKDKQLGHDISWIARHAEPVVNAGIAHSPVGSFRPTVAVGLKKEVDERIVCGTKRRVRGNVFFSLLSLVL